MQVKERSIEYYKTENGKEPVKEWLSSIKDKLTQAILYKRIRQVGLGQFGKTRSVGSGVHEMKIDYGPGFRIYFGIHNDEVIVLLMGGSKRTQTSDIEKAQSYWSQLKGSRS